MNLQQLLYQLPLLQVHGNTDVEVQSVQADSRKVTTGVCFVAIRGTVADGHRFIEACVAQGAVAIICETLPENLASEVTYVQVRDTSLALGIIAGNFYGNPSSHLKIVGVTGTNGKTSVVTLLHRLFMAMGYQCGLVSTVQNQINHEVIPSTHTTPDPLQLHHLFYKMKEAGCEFCFMEVSSHAVVQNRIEGVQFTGAVFTNITHDHLDYHKTFENYLKAKKRFFDELHPSAFALVNGDDRNGMVMVQNTKAARYTYAIKSPSDFKTRIIENSIEGLQLEINHTEMHARLIGAFNAYNITAVYATAVLLGLDKQETLRVLSLLSPPEGRFERLQSANEKIVGIVDYAHTPDALKNVLQTINAVRQGNEKVITVVGCGGDRDREKRPVMAEIACKYSGQVILTSDNPRSEEPDAILQEMNAGVPVTDKSKVLTITDRSQAIKTAVTLAAKGDIILVAGKGHEKYQEVKGIKSHFDDKEELQRCFNELNK